MDPNWKTALSGKMSDSSAAAAAGLFVHYSRRIQRDFVQQRKYEDEYYPSVFTTHDTENARGYSIELRHPNTLVAAP